MRTAAALAGCILIAVILWEAFETIVLPRRVSRRFRVTRAFFRTSWGAWSFVSRRFGNRKRRDFLLGIFGPASVLMLLVFWAAGLVLAFAFLQWANGSRINVPGDGSAGFSADLYLSGTTFFTLGLGDVTPRSPVARIFTVIEGGLGFGFLAVVIGYLPIIYQAFSRREINISMLDARAGSPSTAAELLRRHSESGDPGTLITLMRDWESWSAELMESHISYPALCFFRSQHANQSWVGALTTMLDSCALVMAGIEGVAPWQARLTFAMARHAVVDISQIFGSKPLEEDCNRLTPETLAQLRQTLAARGIVLRESAEAEGQLIELRRMYEPYVMALANYLEMEIPPWVRQPGAKDNWTTSAWKVVH